MKKLFALICVTAMLCSCSSKNSSDKKNDNKNSNDTTTEAASSDNTQTTVNIEDVTFDYSIDDSYEEPIEGVSTDVSKDADVSWSKLYRKALDDFKKSDKYDSTARFTIYDVNDDRIPELIISYGPYGNKNFLIKSLGTKNYTEFEEIQNCSDLYYVMNKSLLVTLKLDEEKHIQTNQLYRLKNDKLANVYTYELSDSYAKVNGQEVDEDKYAEEYNFLINGVIKPIGSDHSFDDDIVNAALGEAADWKEAYCAVLNDYLKYKKADDDNHFSLMDINGDDFPELFVSGGYHYAPYVDIYAWNGCPVPVCSLGADGTVLYYKDKDEVATYFDGPSYTSGSIYKFNDDYKFEELFTYGDTENSKKNDDSVEVAYYINGEKTEKKEYESTVKEKTKGSPYVLGQDNDITEETIKELSEGKYKEASKK